MSYSALTRELSKVRETVFGTTPAAPTMLEVRALKQYDFGVDQGAMESAEKKAHRMRMKSRLGNKKGQFSIPFQLSYGDFDDMFEEALGGTWTPIATCTAMIAAAASPTNTFTRAAGSFITDGFAVGQQIVTSGFTAPADNITAIVSAVTATVLTVSAATTGMVVEASASRTISTTAQRLRVGNIFRSSTFEDRNPAANLYEQFNGAVISGFDLTIEPEKIITGTFKGLVRDCVIAGVGNAAIAVDSAAKTFTCAAGGFLATGASFRVGDNIITTGFTNPGNNGTFVISAVTDTVITCSAAAGLVTEVAGTGKNVYLGTLGTPTAASTNDPYDSFLGDIAEGTVDQAEATGIKINFENSMKPTYAILTPGAAAAASIKPDQDIKAGGEISIFFANQEFKKKYLGGTESTVNVLVGSGLPGGKSMRFIMSAIQYTGNKRTTDSTIVESAPFDANYHAATATCIEIQRIP
ncbi:hypothetical protein KI809_10745 [Geobacter pelophilus]|uniref:Uncharacterized protein n=1 Tax=Geoanaerobacter pelophilus TaxID=60036 RepID=A0AAW4L6W0_9BACT|nr:phage tail tube protein [Geoanaerobacter pelophilus]MBT0664778.1 hypothetical protein [Geoanaerobacter pelophilus]